MSHNQGVDTTSPSRRSVVKGAAWAVPAVIVAGAAPTVAASQGILTFTGNACKLPGNSQSTFKGYVFEFVGNNILGPNPRDAVVEITSISVAGIADLGAYKVVVPGGAKTCSCGPCAGTVADHTVCIPDNTANMQILVYTSADVTGNSANSTVTIEYRVFDCNNTNNCGTAGPTQSTSNEFTGTPPVQGSCPIVGAKQNQP